MKNKLKKILLLLFVVILPITTVFTACGATPTNEVRGVHFVSNEYDDATGYAVFEVDMNVPTKLEYKVNPSSWSGYAITYTTPEDTAENKVRYTLINGVITVSNSAFEQIQVKIHINGKSDTCYIRLKTYPDRIYTDQTSVIVNAFGVYTICPMAEFSNGETKPITEKDYNFLVESNDNTIINVPDSSRLTICSVRKNSASAKVTVTLCDTTGKSKGLSFEVEIKVIQNASDGFLTIDGYGKFVKNGDEVTVNISDLEIDADSGKRILGYNLFVESESGIYTETATKCTTSNSKYLTADSENEIIKIDVSFDLSVTINIWTPLIDGNGNSFAIIFKLNINT